MYIVFGYDWDCCGFEITLDSFVKAVECYRQYSWTVVFMKRAGDPNSCRFVQ